MTIDEAIKHYGEVAEKEERNAKLHPRPDKDVKGSGKKYLICLEHAEEHRQLAEWLKELKQLREQTRWIPVSERLPEEGGDYLVTIKWKGSYSGDVYIETNMAVYREKYKEWDCVGVIAWMPVPQSYKAESEEA